MSFADQLLAYHEPALCDDLFEFLKELVAPGNKTKEAIKQVIWRVLVVGWFKFARDASSALQLL